MRSISDLLGFSLSAVCAIQCALLPVLIGLTPALPAWAHIGHGWWWLGLVAAVATLAFARGYARHRHSGIIALAVMGFSLLVFGNWMEGRLLLWQETAVFVGGGVMLMFAHWRNYRASACRPAQMNRSVK